MLPENKTEKAGRFLQNKELKEELSLWAAPCV